MPDGTKQLGPIRGTTPARDPRSSVPSDPDRRRSPFEAVFEDAAIGIALVDMQGHPVQTNPAIRRMLGYSAEELREMAFTQFTHPEDVNADWDLFAQLVSGEREHYQIEKRYLRKDGRIVWGRLTASLLRNERGQPEHAVGMVEDITERKAAEEALHDHARRLTALHSIDQGILAARSLEDLARTALSQVRDLVPCDRASIVLAAGRDEALLFGVNLSGETGLGEGARIPLGDAGDILRLLRAGQPFIVEDLREHPELPAPYQVLRSEGLRTYVSWPMIAGEKLVGSLNVASERPGAFTEPHLEVAQEVADQLAIAITQVRLREAERERTSELESTVRELRTTDEQRRQLLARLVRAQEEERQRIAGDVRDDTIQGMTAVGMRIATLRTYLPDDPAPRQALAELEQSVSRSIGRLRNLLVELHPPALDQRGGLRMMLRDNLERLAEDTGLSIGLDEAVSGEISDEARAICYRIAQEALANVRKHARATRVDVRVASSDGGVLIGIRDDGVGFSPAVGPDGLPGGLGLASMRERAEVAGGWWRLTSAPGEGTNVEFWLPA